MKAALLRRRAGKIIIGIALIMTGLLFLLEFQLRPLIDKSIVYQGNLLATRVINQSAYDEIDDELFDYTRLINVQYNADGTVSSLESNMMNINRVKTMITQNINDALSSLDTYELSLSAGTISGIPLLYGQGPKLPLTVEPVGYVETELISRFSEAGINQTMHRIILNVSVDISAIIPGYSASSEINTAFVVAETIIVGVVPNSYTHVITGTQDIIREINDYGAS